MRVRRCVVVLQCGWRGARRWLQQHASPPPPHPQPAPHLSVRMFSKLKTYAAACDDAALRTSSTSLLLFSLRAGFVFVNETSFARFDLGIAAEATHAQQGGTNTQANQIATRRDLRDRRPRAQ